MVKLHDFMNLFHSAVGHQFLLFLSCSKEDCFFFHKMNCLLQVPFIQVMELYHIMAAYCGTWKTSHVFFVNPQVQGFTFHFKLSFPLCPSVFSEQKWYTAFYYVDINKKSVNDLFGIFYFDWEFHYVIAFIYCFSEFESGDFRFFYLQVFNGETL